MWNILLKLHILKVAFYDVSTLAHHSLEICNYYYEHFRKIRKPSYQQTLVEIIEKK